MQTTIEELVWAAAGRPRASGRARAKRAEDRMAESTRERKKGRKEGGRRARARRGWSSDACSLRGFVRGHAVGRPFFDGTIETGITRTIEGSHGHVHLEPPRLPFREECPALLAPVRRALSSRPLAADLHGNETTCFFTSEKRLPIFAIGLKFTRRRYYFITTTWVAGRPIIPGSFWGPGPRASDTVRLHISHLS
jgi:hypothetical protein